MFLVHTFETIIYLNKIDQSKAIYQENNFQKETVNFASNSTLTANFIEENNFNEINEEEFNFSFQNDGISTNDETTFDCVFQNKISINRCPYKLSEVLHKGDYFLDFKRVLNYHLASQCKTKNDIMQNSSMEIINLYGVITSVKFAKKKTNLIVIYLTSLKNSNTLVLNFYGNSSFVCPFEPKQILFITKAKIYVSTAFTLFFTVKKTEITLSEEKINDIEYNKLIKFKCDRDKHCYDFIWDILTEKILYRSVVKVLKY